jgi:transcriptional regulator with XRE-family HTH domain
MEERREMARLRVKELAQAKGMSMLKLSRMADVSVDTARKLWRYPADYDPSLFTLEKVAKALGVALQDLIGGDDSETVVR